MCMGATQPRIQWILNFFSLVKRQGSEVDLTPTSRSKNEWEELYLCSTNMPAWCGHRVFLLS
jgi:hypothetical protein